MPFSIIYLLLFILGVSLTIIGYKNKNKLYFLGGSIILIIFVLIFIYFVFIAKENINSN